MPTPEKTYSPATEESLAPTYLQVTRTATYGFLSALPLLLLYEALILFVNQGSVSQVRVGAEVWMKQALAALGGVGLFAVGLVVLAVGIGIFLYERKKKIPLRPVFFGWMIAESTVYAVAVALLVSNVVGLLFYIAPVQVVVPLALGSTLMEQGLLTQLTLSLGAGIYEELLFRVILVGGLYWILKRAQVSKNAAYIVSALVGALLFSWVHYIGPLGDAFTMASFSFRFLFGLVLNVIFLLRGFGVAAWTHALYDVMVVTHFFG